MSRVFSDTTDKDGIIQEIESECGFNDGDISGNSVLLAKFTAAVNQALDSFYRIALTADGRWQFDDSNHTKYPIITTNLVSGQRDYALTTDQQGNLLLDVHRVAVLPSSSATLYQELDPFDELQDRDNDIVTGSTTTGIPTRYGKLANGIFLDTPSSYNATLGLKVFVSREGSYFATSDTTKMPGVPGIFHDYFYLRPSLDYARRNNLANYPRLREAVLDLEGDERLRTGGKIREYFAYRSRDERNIMTFRRINHI